MFASWVKYCTFAGKGPSDGLNTSQLEVANSTSDSSKDSKMLNLSSIYMYNNEHQINNVKKTVVRQQFDLEETSVYRIIRLFIYSDFWI